MQATSLLQLRAENERDLDFSFDVFASTRSEELQHLPLSADRKQAFLQQQFEAQYRYYREHFTDAQFSIVECDGIPIGRLYVHSTAEALSIMDIALLPQYRSAGIGTTLIQNIVDLADRERKPIRLHVERFNPAIRLYDRFGFRLVEDTGIYLLMERIPSE
jgi:ribosomal protein S18 acetylase RimI-like enzyme